MYSTATVTTVSPTSGLVIKRHLVLLAACLLVSKQVSLQQYDTVFAVAGRSELG
jgi:hypothetical protein